MSFGIHETEEQAARQYDRALVIEKGRSAKTNFPLGDYEKEVQDYRALLQQRSVPCQDSGVSSWEAGKLFLPRRLCSTVR